MWERFLFVILHNLLVIKLYSHDWAHQPMEYIAIPGGIFLDMSTHDFEMVRHLPGPETTEGCAYSSMRSDVSAAHAMISIQPSL